MKTPVLIVKAVALFGATRLDNSCPEYRQYPLVVSLFLKESYARSFHSDDWKNGRPSSGPRDHSL
jgi:hypothetical protein